MPTHISKRELRHRKSVPHRYLMFQDSLQWFQNTSVSSKVITKEHAHSVQAFTTLPYPSCNLTGPCLPHKLMYRPAYHALTGLPKAANMERPKAERGVAFPWKSGGQPKTGAAVASQMHAEDLIEWSAVGWPNWNQQNGSSRSVHWQHWEWAIAGTELFSPLWIAAWRLRMGTEPGWGSRTKDSHIISNNQIGQWLVAYPITLMMMSYPSLDLLYLTASQ